MSGNPLNRIDPLGLADGLSGMEACKKYCSDLGLIVKSYTPTGLGFGFCKCDSKKDKCPSTREDLDTDLKNKGFNEPSTSEKGYKTYKHPDGTKVTVKPDGEVIRTQNKWKADGSGKYPERQDYSGNRLPDQSHTTGDFVK